MRGVDDAGNAVKATMAIARRNTATEEGPKTRSVHLSLKVSIFFLANETISKKLFFYLIRCLLFYSDFCSSGSRDEIWIERHDASLYFHYIFVPDLSPIVSILSW